MQDTTNPQWEVETIENSDDAIEQVADPAEKQNADPGDGQDTGETETPDEFEELDEDGERYSVPKKLAGKYREYRAGAMKAADYTQKTQSLAEEKRRHDEFVAASRANMDDRVALHAIDLRLKQLSQLDWGQILNESSDQAFLLQREEQALQGQRQQLHQKISQFENDQALKKQQETAKRIQDGLVVLQREIKGWNDEYARKLAGYGKENGLSDEALSAILDPAQVKILNKAYLYDQLMKKQAASRAAVPEVKPIKTVGGGAKATSSLPSDRDPIEVWVRKENARVAAKRRT